jgi:hypothetical protein
VILLGLKVVFWELIFNLFYLNQLNDRGPEVVDDSGSMMTKTQ